VRPGRKDRRYNILIDGQELATLQNYTWAMAEAYGLDSRIARYKGTRPIGLWSWDLDCLEAVLDNAIRDCRESDSQECRTLQSLQSKIQSLLDKARPNGSQ